MEKNVYAITNDSSGQDRHIEDKIEHGAEQNNRTSSTKVSQRIVRRADWRILPICGWIYLLNYLDRGNIGNARLLNHETGDSLLQTTDMSSNDYALTVSMFSVAYFLFEVPSNLIMKKWFRPSVWLALLMFLWGAVTMGFSGVQNFPMVIILRLFIGTFEAGFFPAVVFLITQWYRVEERSIRIAFIVASATLAGAFGGLIAYGVGHMNGRAGLEGFRWLFIIEGLITVCSVIPVLAILPDYPATAKWLSNDERTMAEERLKDQNVGSELHRSAPRSKVACAALHPRMLAHYLAYLTNAIPLGSLTFFTPTIVAGLGYDTVEAQLMTVPPWVVGYIVSLVLAYSADRFDARGLHVAFATTFAGAGWLTAALLPAHRYTARYGCLIMAACGAFPCAAPLSAWVTSNVLSVDSLVIAVALNNSMGGLSQLVSQWIFLPQEANRGYPTANYICAACSFTTAVIALGLSVMYGRMNRNVVETRHWYR